MSEMEMIVCTSQTEEEGRKALTEHMENDIRGAFQYEMEQEKEHMKSKDLVLLKKHKIRRVQ